MKTLNSVIIEGNIVNKPILKLTPKGTAICNFSIAANRSYKKDNEFTQETSYFEIETWATLAELCEKYGVKGRCIRAVGRLKQDRRLGADGKNYSKIKIIAERVEFKPIIKKD